MKPNDSDHDQWRSRIHDAWASFRKEHDHLGHPREGEGTPRAPRADGPSTTAHRA